MNTVHKVLAAAVLVVMSGRLFAAAMQGTLIAQSQSGFHMSTSEEHFYVDQADYVNGGVTFNYPASWFSAAPMVRVSIELKNATYSASEHMTCCVTANSASSTTVRVNKGTTASISEAATDDVIVHIHAVGDA